MSETLGMSPKHEIETELSFFSIKVAEAKTRLNEGDLINAIKILSACLFPVDKN